MFEVFCGAGRPTICSTNRAWLCSGSTDFLHDLCCKELRDLFHHLFVVALRRHRLSHVRDVLWHTDLRFLLHDLLMEAVLRHSSTCVRESFLELGEVALLKHKLKRFQVDLRHGDVDQGSDLGHLLAFCHNKPYWDIGKLHEGRFASTISSMSCGIGSRLHWLWHCALWCNTVAIALLVSPPQALAPFPRAAGTGCAAACIVASSHHTRDLPVWVCASGYLWARGSRSGAGLFLLL